MTIDTEDTGEQPNVDIGNLDDFEKDFYPTDKGAKAPTKETVEEVEEGDEVSAESEEVEDLATEEESEEEGEADDESEEEEEPEPKPKKKHSAQERFNELTAKARQAEREVEALRREVETLKAGREKEEPKTLRAVLPDGAPDPDAFQEDGVTPVYPLGEFDKMYIRDLTKFTIETESKAQKEKDAQEDWDRGVKAAQAELAESWIEKVDKAEAEIPTLRDDITDLTNVFENIEPNYGEYLAMTIMQSENGPEIMHYFSQNIGEAQTLVASGPAAATLAIGRLDAKLSKPSTKQKESPRNKTVSKAPTPPEKGARGVNGRQAVKPDTDNLEAFEGLFYQK